MQRVRIGLTGLASVFLAVLLAAVFTGRTHDEAPACRNPAQSAAGPGVATQDGSQKEPLADIGVVPNCDSNVTAAAAEGASPAGRR